MANLSLAQAMKLVPLLRTHPLRHMWIDYDEGADVLYVSFEKPQCATDSELTERGVIRRLRGRKLVGLTILNARKGHR